MVIGINFEWNETMSFLIFAHPFMFQHIEIN
jgi:hypothetical protein